MKEQEGRRQSARSILHIDMNAFYCACHAAADPARYQNRATAVAGSPETRHGVVVTASYPARARGVRATMTVAEALRVCPDLILIHPDFDLYRRYSNAVFTHVRNFTPQIEIFSIDECFADVTGSGQFGTPLDIARTLQERIAADLGLSCSVGVAPNKFLAKMASDLKKPMGLTEIRAEDVATVLWPLPIQMMFGVGAKTAERLRHLGIHTIGDLAHAAPERLLRSLGKRGLEIVQLANGQDDAPVQSEAEPHKSIGHSITLAADSDHMEELYTILMNLSDQVGRRVRRHGLFGRTIQLTIRYANRETVTRSRTLATPTQLSEVIYEEARNLLNEHRRRGAKVRLLGVTLQNLGTERQAAETGHQLELPLFAEAGAAEMPVPLVDDANTRLQKLTEVTDQLRGRFGEDIVVRGRMMQPHESKQIRDRKIRGTSLQKDNLQ